MRSFVFAPSDTRQWFRHHKSGCRHCQNKKGRWYRSAALREKSLGDKKPPAPDAVILWRQLVPMWSEKWRDADGTSSTLQSRHRIFRAACSLCSATTPKPVRLREVIFVSLRIPELLLVGAIAVLHSLVFLSLRPESLSVAMPSAVVRQVK